MELTLSVIVCAHNEAGYLGACLHSLLAQSRPPDEIIVVNNDSSDGTGEVAAGLAGVRVVDEPLRARDRTAGSDGAGRPTACWWCRAPR